MQQANMELFHSAPRLDTQGIADYLGLSREHVTARLTKRADFPKPFINASRRIRYWRTAEVKAWAEGRR
jgi:predicted DNA-binding transcriptional regulator AlpA